MANYSVISLNIRFIFNLNFDQIFFEYELKMLKAPIFEIATNKCISEAQIHITRKFGKIHIEFYDQRNWILALFRGRCCSIKLAYESSLVFMIICKK